MQVAHIAIVKRNATPSQVYLQTKKLSFKAAPQETFKMSAFWQPDPLSVSLLAVLWFRLKCHA